MNGAVKRFDPRSIEGTDVEGHTQGVRWFTARTFLLNSHAACLVPGRGEGRWAAVLVAHRQVDNEVVLASLEVVRDALHILAVCEPVDRRNLHAKRQVVVGRPCCAKKK